MGTHIFRLFGANSDVAHNLERIQKPHDARTGSYGRVYQVHHKDKHLPALFAVKVLHNHGWQPARALQLCLREAWTWGQLKHPNVVPLYGLANYAALVNGGVPQLCLISPWASHGNMQDYMHAADISFSETLLLFRDMASGLEYLHKRQPNPIIHGDLKANNVLLFTMFDDRMGGNRTTARLVDFGLSRSWQEGESRIDTTTTVYGGNPRWLAWERLDPLKFEIPRGVLSFTTQSDIFELMRTLLEILTKRPPYFPLPDPEALHKILNAENPERPSVGVLASHHALWRMMLQCWSTQRVQRLDARDVTNMIDYFTVCEHLQVSYMRPCIRVEKVHRLSIWRTIRCPV